ncbi:MAG: glycosyltransferase family 4 protein [Bacilli bacterium]|nr:glycosyltransferase family 4 protein [Bacilli bacterium]
MKKKIWIINHYATRMYMNKGGRHYWFAKELLKRGYEPTIICANTYHNSKNYEDTGSAKHIVKDVDGIPFVFVKTKSAVTNGLDRIINMLGFYRNLFPVSKTLVKKYGKPDIILASSVHPLTMVAGIKIARKIKVPCICEIRDLWPESLIAYGMLRKGSLLSILLYEGEKWIYKKADAIIMTWEGGKQYIIDQKWDNKVQLDKIFHITNGVDLEQYYENIKLYDYKDIDLDDKSIFKLVYAGSIRKVNNLSFLLEVAKSLLDYSNIKFIIFGSGDQLEILKDRAKNEIITNITFKGFVEKKYIPSVLSKADVNILHNSSTSLDKYGQSQNKLFEYLASGKPIIQTYKTEYSLFEKYNCGINCEEQSVECVKSHILRLINDNLLYETIGSNAKKIVENYDFKRHTDKLENIITDLLQ